MKHADHPTAAQTADHSQTVTRAQIRDLTSKQISKSEYDAAFGVSGDNSQLRKQALAQALDIRKFEISLYWTRAAYFWAFNTVALGAYGALQTLSSKPPPQLCVLVSCVGIISSFAWYCANRGSKQWQENWENHVDL